MDEPVDANREHPVRAILVGTAAGVVATAAMTVLMVVAERLGLVGTQPPEKITRRLLNRVSPVFGRGARRQLSAGAHFGFGAAAGGAFGLLRRLFPATPAGLMGILYGVGVYLVSYVGWLPALGLMPPPTDDRPGRQPALAAGHIAYGAVLGVVTHALRKRLRS